MRVLFVLASPEFLRFYDSTIRLLAARGHWVGLAVNEQKDAKPVRLEHLDGGEQVEPLGIVPRRADWWSGLAPVVRGATDYVRYLSPRYASAPALRARVAKKGLPPALRFIDTRLDMLSDASVARLVAGLSRVERAMPPSREVAAFFERHRPDVVIVSPLVDTASDQVDAVRSAQALEIRTVAAIASWDNLTNKGLLRVTPDLVTVWNEAQKREAIEMHGIPAGRITVTGAQLFDKWFERMPSRSREEFARRVGLPSARPFILFTGSSMFISAPEAEVAFVRRWIRALRASDDPDIRDANILIRPHPYNGWIWADQDMSEFTDVAVWPRGRYNPVDESNRDDYFDSLSYCRVVVGINTSAMVEATILGKPVHSIVTSDFAKTQEGTLHFRYLLPEHGGFLRVASSLDEHVTLLSATLRDEHAAREEATRFVSWFVRPHGLDQACTPLLVDAIETLAAQPRPAKPTTTAGDLLLRALLLPLLPLIPLLDGWQPLQRRLSRGKRLQRLFGPLSRLPRNLRWSRKHAVRFVRSLAARVRRGLRGSPHALRFACGWLLRRVLRLIRLARYEVAVLIKGERRAS
jgi:hypothetical protein